MDIAIVLIITHDKRPNKFEQIRIARLLFLHPSFAITRGETDFHFVSDRIAINVDNPMATRLRVTLIVVAPEV